MEPIKPVDVAGVDTSVCPLCGEANRCAMEIERQTGQKQGPCWCMQVNFSEELLARVPVEKKRLACICEKCARGGAVRS